MSPRGFWSKELITPYFTSEQYINSDQHKEEVDHYIAIEGKIRSIFSYPRKIAFKVWHKVMVWTGQIKDLDKNTYL